MSNYEQEIRNRQFKQATGSAPNFRAIDGVGDKTARAVRQVRGIDSPSDAADKTADELADEAGISQSRAEKVIRGGGGNPNRSPRSNTGSVSAAGIKVPTGDFKTEIGDKDNAQARFDSSINRGIGRSQEAASADKGKRAPVTTDFERWKDNKGELDYPGVDTPTDDPQVLPKDLRQKQRPNTTTPTETRERRERESVPETPSGRFASEPEGSRLSSTDISLSPGEAFRGDGAVGMNNLGSFSPSRGEERAPSVGTERPPGDAIEQQDRALSIEEREQQAADAGVLDPEPSDPFDMSDGGGVLNPDRDRPKAELELPDETLSFARTQLNEKVYGEGREELDDLRQRVSTGESVEVDRDEYRALKNAVFQGANEAQDRAKRMERNIFGDTDEQAEFANTARRGIINNPPEFGEGR